MANQQPSGERKAEKNSEAGENRILELFKSALSTALNLLPSQEGKYKSLKANFEIDSSMLDNFTCEVLSDISKHDDEFCVVDTSNLFKLSSNSTSRDLEQELKRNRNGTTNIYELYISQTSILGFTGNSLNSAVHKGFNELVESQNLPVVGIKVNALENNRFKIQVRYYKK